MENGFGSGGHGVVSSLEIRDWGASTRVLLLWYGTHLSRFEIQEVHAMRWSSTSLSNVCRSIGGNDDDDEEAADKIDEKRSPGCFPNKTSIVTTSSIAINITLIFHSLSLYKLILQRRRMHVYALLGTSKDSIFLSTKDS